MTLTRALTALLATGTLSVGLVVGSTTAAHAVDYTYSMQTASLPNGGFGQVTGGTVTWVTNKDADVGGRVTDRCNGDDNGDGRGAYLYARATFGNGSKLADFLWADTDGCSDTAVSRYYAHSVYNPDDRNIAAVEVRLCYNDGMPSGWNDCERAVTTQVMTRP